MRRLTIVTACICALTACLPAGAEGATRWTLRGAGWGHGIGMSQFGAYGYARHGFNYRDILTHYYRGTRIERRSPTLVRVLLQANRSSVTFTGATRAGERRLKEKSVYRATRSGPNVVLRSSSGRTLQTFADVIPVTGEETVRLLGKAGNGVTNGYYRGEIDIRTAAGSGLNAINTLGIENYVQGVVPAESPPIWPLQALAAQAVAARTYALAHRGQFEAEGYDLCATPKCQVYSGLSAEDPLTNGAVEATRGLVLASGGVFADALFISTCGGRTENVENVFIGEPAPYLVSVECAELSTAPLAGARVRSAPASGRSGLEWRGYVLDRHAPRRRGGRAGLVSTAQAWAGIEGRAVTPASLSASDVYPAIIAAFDLASARAVHVLPREQRYYSEPPPATGRLSGAARDAYAFLLRFRFGAGEPLPAADGRISEEEYSGLLLSGALRLLGVSEGSGRFLSREASNVWVKTTEGRFGLPVDPDLPLARRVGDRWFVSGALNLRAGDRLRWWKRGSRVRALWVEVDAAGPSFERESAWTEWVRRVSGRELARRMSGRVAGTEVRDLVVTKRSPTGRVTELRAVTDATEITLQGFDLRQALEVPEMLFTFSRARGPQGEREFVFLGRGWGHGVGLCQNGAFGMALAGSTYDAILRHYYRGIEIVPASTVKATPATLR
jgi:peptidoglycan hydrolase-like amidase